MDILFQIIMGWILADFLSGLLHWWEDDVGREDMPLLGPLVISPNRLHHIDALDFTRRSILKRNAPLWTVTMMVALAWWLVFGPSVMLFTTALAASLIGEIQVLAHIPERGNRLTRFLQRLGFIQSPEHHALHHRFDGDGRGVGDHYCALTNYLNPILDRIGFWWMLDRAFAMVGMAPNRGTK